MGIWPPSNPTLWYPPLRARCPLTPRPQVLPWPAEAPRPTRSRGRLAPGAGLSVLSRISLLSSSARALDLQQVHGGLDHAAVLRRVGDGDRLADAAQPEAARAGGDVGKLAVQALDERDLQLFALCCVHARQPVISSRLLPRFAAISSGERILASAFTVARTTLIGLREP